LGYITGATKKEKVTPERK